MAMMMMMKQGLLLGSSLCPHFLSPETPSFKQHILLKTKKTTECVAIDDFKEILQFRHPAATVIVANALMITSPLDALAETCEADNSLFNMNMPLLLLVALIGATVGGLLARQRKAELQRLNEQLRQINAALRRQAKIESYAPNLSYAPAGGRVAESENLKEPLKEKKATRGLGASLQRQGKYREAIKYHSLVLELSAKHGEESGSTEAYGAIADCYTELGDLEQAAKYYDQYIARLETD
ncbi:hypothetical protein K7X08_023394 [Anisodus acutangulus]|uniref:Uncharacterized protein n=1 Tax=Anisodus acutangulus TaxID=402998 RepID=A0A9Q1LF51_9SOLA|nr:hypothetical protein K7X08_023394 [Anisodus acutangulus]